MCVQDHVSVIWKWPSYSWDQDLVQMVTSFHFCSFCTFVYLCPCPPRPLAQRPSSVFKKRSSRSPVEIVLMMVGCTLTDTSRNRLLWKRRGRLWILQCEEEETRCDLSEEPQLNKHKHLWDVWIQPTEVSVSWSLLKESYFSLFLP